MKRIVIALGGNALQKPGEQASAENQRKAVAESAEHIADMIADGYEVVIAHGNGPQVGRIVQQNEYASSLTPAMPLDVCSAMSQGMIGYQMQQCLQNALKRRNIAKDVVSVVTQVEVDANDAGFTEPTKPIGRFYSQDELKDKTLSDSAIIFREDAGRGWRRVVASPRPVNIVEINAIRALLEKGVVPIAVGGGGIPVFRRDNGAAQGATAVIDKDFTAELLAEKLDADILLILTGVEKVCIHFGKPDETRLDTLTAEQARHYINDGEFAPGSMLPKIEASLKFIESKCGRRSLITSLEKATSALHGKTGTVLVLQNNPYALNLA